MLSYNPSLQAEFKEVVKKASEKGLLRIMIDVHEKTSVTDSLLRIMSEAINELALPEEEYMEMVTQKATDRNPIECLSEDHGFWWWFTHCTWPVRGRLALLVLGGASAIFLAGLRIGMMDSVKRLYIQYTNPQITEPTAEGSIPQPTISPSNVKQTETASKTLAQPTTNATSAPKPVSALATPK